MIVSKPLTVGEQRPISGRPAWTTGNQSVSLLIDDKRYAYSFNVATASKPNPVLEIRQQSAYQVDPIKLRVAGHEDFKVHRIELTANVPKSHELSIGNGQAQALTKNGTLGANGELKFFGKCLDDDGLWHWGDCSKYDGSFTMSVQVTRRYEMDPSGLNRPGYVIRAIMSSGLSPVDADDKVLFFNGPPRAGSKPDTCPCPYRLVINTEGQDEVVQSITMEPMSTGKETASLCIPMPPSKIPETDP